MGHRMPEAIAKLLERQADGKWISRGTAFAVSPQLALTAFHVIGNRLQGEARDGPFELHFPGGHSCEAKFQDGDSRLDFALLSMMSRLPEDLQPIGLTGEAHEADGFVSRGFPPLQNVDTLTIAGTVRNPQGTIFNGVPAIQLFSHEAAAEMPLGGMSGAPVLVGSSGKQAAIGLIRWNPTRPNDPTLSLGGTLFACPMEAIADRKPELRAGFVRVITPLPPVVLQNLPFAPNPLFTGRDTELEALRQGLQQRGTMAVTQTVAVHGLGGVGKTQLAVQYAWNHLREFDAVLWARADSSEALEADLAALAFVLRLPEAKQREQAVQSKAALNWLAEHERWLLIIDNADTEATARAVGQLLLPSLPGAVLITSRLSRWPINVSQLPLDLFSAEQAARYLLARVSEQRHEAGNEEQARKLAEELGYLPLALEQAGSFIVELKWTFERYQAAFREARPELLNYQAEGGTRYPASVAKTWSVGLEQLGLLARILLRMAAWFAPDGIPRGIFSADNKLLSEVLNGQTTVLTEVAIEKALGELDRLSLVHLTSKTVSLHRLLQAVEQDTLSGADCKRWLDRAARLFNAFTPGSPDDARTWDVWLPLVPHAEALLENAKRHVVDTPPIALVANQFGLLLLARGAYSQAAPAFSRSLAISEKELGPEHPHVATYLNNLGEIHRIQGEYGKAEPLYHRALTIREKALGPEHPDVAQSLSNLALLYQHRGLFGTAGPLFHRALMIREKALGPDHPNVALSLSNLAGLYYNQGQYAKAQPLFHRALEIREKALGPDHPDVAQSLNNLTKLYDDRGQYAKAEPLLKRALAIREKALGPDHPNVAQSLNNLAGLYYKQRQYANAEPLYHRALEIREKALGPDHPDVATSLNNLAALYDDQGQYANAERLYLRTLAIREKAQGPEHPSVGTTINNLALLYLNQNQYGKAEPLFHRALEISEKALGPDHPNVALSLSNLATLYYEQGQYAKAESLYKRALAISEKALGPDHPNVATSLNSLALLYQAQGQHGKAKPLFQRVAAMRGKK